MNPKKKTPKSFQETIDSISDLPDPILTLILSSLPTKNAVATSVLSKRWKSLWTKVLNLDFSHYGNEDENMKFVRFVNSILLHKNDAESLHKFRLVWRDSHIPSQVNSWISTAITRNIREIVLSLGRNGMGGGGPSEDIPTSIFSSGTLQSLELKGIMWVPTSIVVCLPKLETLKFVSVYFKSEEALQKIIHGCPMLNYLHLVMAVDIQSQYFTGDEFKYIISSTSLRRLQLGVDCWGDPFPCRLELEASSLEYLKLEGFISQILVQGSLSSLVEADFRIQWSDDSEFTEADDYNSVVEAVEAFDCAKSLTLSTHVMWALSHATIRLSTKFSRLKKLKAGVDCFYCSSLEDFIQSSDNLEVLTIYQDSISRYLTESSVFGNDNDNWTAPVEVLRCLSNSLKAVVFDGYSGSEDEREMIGYMLKHGSALEVMQISFHRNMHGVHSELDQERLHSELEQEICKFPRKSTACKVEFSGSCFGEPRAGENEMINSLTSRIL